VLTGPGFFGGGQVSRLVSLVDLPPTLLDAARIPVPEVMSGSSILPLLRGETAGWPQDVLIQISESEIGRAVRTLRWKYSVTSPIAQGRGDSAEYTEAYLYDMEFDPYELSNLIGLTSHRQVADRMKERLVKRMTDIGEAVPVIHNADPKPGGGRWVTANEIEQ
jgi:arylsulfatase A-like enzyme